MGRELSEEDQEGFGYYPEQLCKHGNPDGVVCDRCKDEENEIEES